MSEIGSEVGSATLQIGEKGLSELLNLLKYLLSLRDPNKKIAKMQAKQMKKDIKASKEYEGQINLKNLKKSGKVVPLSVPMKEEQMKKFENYAKMVGLPYSAISNKNIKQELKEVEEKIEKLKEEYTGKDISENAEYKVLDEQKEKLQNMKKEFIIVVREDDLLAIKGIIDKMNYEELNSTLENSSLPEEIINEEKEANADNLFEEFNQVSNDSFLSGREDIGIDDSITTIMGIDGAIIVDRMDPDTYIEMNISSELNAEGVPFNISDFKVVNKGVEQECSTYKTGKYTYYSDKNFESTSEKGVANWKKAKEEMKEKCGIVTAPLIFKNKDEWEKYKNIYIKKNDEFKLDEMKDLNVKVDEIVFYDVMPRINEINELEKKIDGLNPEDEKIKIMIREKENLEKLNETQNKIARGAVVGEDIDEYKKNYKELLKDREEIINRSRTIASVEAVKEMKQQRKTETVEEHHNHIVDYKPKSRGKEYFDQKMKKSQERKSKETKKTKNKTKDIGERQ